MEVSHIGALRIRIGFWGRLYYSFKKEPQKRTVNYLGPYIGVDGLSLGFRVCELESNLAPGIGVSGCVCIPVVAKHFVLASSRDHVLADDVDFFAAIDANRLDLPRKARSIKPSPKGPPHTDFLTTCAHRLF